MTKELATKQTQRLRLAQIWLGAGAALLLLQLLTPLPLIGPRWGWTPLYWLLLAPLSVMAVLRPSSPLHWLAQHWRRRGYR